MGIGVEAYAGNPSDLDMSAMTDISGHHLAGMRKLHTRTYR
jgi:hypothetical protein